MGLPRRQRLDVLVTKVEGQLGAIKNAELSLRQNGFGNLAEQLGEAHKALTRAVDMTLSCAFCAGHVRDVECLITAGKDSDRAAICADCLKMCWEIYKETGKSPTF